MIETSDLKKLHVEILHKFMELEIIGNDAQLLNFEGKRGTNHTAYIRLDIEDEDIFLVTSLPRNKEKMFLTVTDGNPQEIAVLLSEIEDADLDRCFHKHDVIRFESEFLQNYGKVGTLLLPVNISNVFSNFEGNITASGYILEVLLCVFISNDEYIYWKKYGNDKLMDKFSLESKDLISLN